MALEGLEKALERLKLFLNKMTHTANRDLECRLTLWAVKGRLTFWLRKMDLVNFELEI